MSQTSTAAATLPGAIVISKQQPTSPAAAADTERYCWRVVHVSASLPAAATIGMMADRLKSLQVSYIPITFVISVMLHFCDNVFYICYVLSTCVVM